MEQDNRPNKTSNQSSTSDDVRATITKANRASASLWMVLHAKVSMVRFWRLRKKSVLFVADNIMAKLCTNLDILNLNLYFLCSIAVKASVYIKDVEKLN